MFILLVQVSIKPCHDIICCQVKEMPSLTCHDAICCQVKDFFVVLQELGCLLMTVIISVDVSISSVHIVTLVDDDLVYFFFLLDLAEIVNCPHNNLYSALLRICGLTGLAMAEHAIQCCAQQ